MWDDGIFWNGVAGGELLLRTCRQCHAICHPPLPMCPQCQGLAWDTRPASGRAALRAWLVSAHPHQVNVHQLKAHQENAHQPNADHRVVVVVQLEEGVSFVSNVIGIAVAELYEGMPLELCFDTVDGVMLPLFRAAPKAGGDA